MFGARFLPLNRISGFFSGDMEFFARSVDSGDSVDGKL